MPLLPLSSLLSLHHLLPQNPHSPFFAVSFFLFQRTCHLTYYITYSFIMFIVFLIEIHVLLFIYLFIYLWLCWVFVSVQGLSLVVASGDHSSSRCTGLSPSRPLLLQSTGSRRTGSVIVAHGPSCSMACGIFPDQGSNPCPLHWQADSQPLRHQGSPYVYCLQCLSLARI